MNPDEIFMWTSHLFAGMVLVNLVSQLIVARRARLMLKAARERMRATCLGILGPDHELANTEDLLALADATERKITDDSRDLVNEILEAVGEPRSQ